MHLIQHQHVLEQCANLVPVSALSHADSPRLNGINEEHARALAETDDELPPIVVHSPTMSVVDGMHRLRAAILRGQHEIDVRFVGDEVDVFALAVEMNTKHGFPLSRADRKAAAIRLIQSHPDWSDRRIADITKLAARTVAAQRAQVVESGQPAAVRVGKDGRLRPVDGAPGRQRALDFMASNPDASIRSVARAAGVSPATVLGIRKRMANDTEQTHQRDDTTRVDVPRMSLAHRDNRPPQDSSQRKNEREMLRALTRDPSLNLSENGRLLLRSLHMCTVDLDSRQGLAEAVPTHCTARVAALARAAGAAWLELADKLDRT